MAHQVTRRSQQADFVQTATQLAALGREFHARGWALGTSGNFSVVLTEVPLRLAITASGLDKGLLRPDQILEINGRGNLLDGANRLQGGRSASGRPRAPYRPSDETK